MKKICLLLIASFGIIFSHAQIRWGPDVGLSLYTLNVKPSDPSYDYKYKAGFEGGVVVLFDVSKEFGVRTGLNFTMEGSKGVYVPPTSDLSFNLKYLNLPCMQFIKEKASMVLQVPN